MHKNFEGVKKIYRDKHILDISDIINRNTEFYAHLKENKKETLIEHTELCTEYYLKIFNFKGIDEILKKFEEEYFGNIGNKYRDIFRTIVKNVPVFHDIGKVNPKFQSEKMDKDINLKRIKNKITGNHSMLSAILYLNYFTENIKDIEKKDEELYLKMYNILFINAYIISRHHSNLEKFETFKEKIEDDDIEIQKIIKFINSNSKDILNSEINVDLEDDEIYDLLEDLEELKINNSIYLYSYARLIYSVLVAADFYSTSEFMNGVKTEDFGEIEDINKIYNVYKNTEISKSIRSYEKNQYNREKDLTKETNINVLRTEMFLDAEQELEKNMDKDIFFLEAPTGSGKSNVSMNLSFKLIEKDKSLKKIYYVYPFNTLIEQNVKSINKTFGNNENILDDIAVINSVTPIKVSNNYGGKEYIYENEDENINYNEFEKYQKALLNRQFMNYPIVLTTHVGLFNMMFNKTKEAAFSFHQLANSVIVLDEIQSYKNLIWTEIITFLKSFARLLNIKIIIMSATLPDLSYLSDETEGVCRLIKNRDKYFLNPLFKDRVNANYELMESGIKLDDIHEHIKEKSKLKNKILVEFINKSSAYDFYDRLKDDEEIVSEVELLTGDDNIAERKRILDKISDTEDIILIATQVIEAGVDIDMDIGYKDISKLDSEEQFMGRINRSCKKDGTVYFFNMDKATLIYKDDLRVNKEFTLEDDNIKSILSNKNFDEYYNPIMNALKENFNDKMNDHNIKSFFEDSVGKLDFDKVNERMTLINDEGDNISVYLSRNIEVDGDIKYGNEIWKRYKSLLRDNEMDYAKKRVELSRVKSDLNYFMYSVKKYNESSISFNDKIGDIYFIEDGDNYIKNNKVDKDKLITGIGDFI